MANKTKIRGITIQLDADTSGLSKSLSDVNGKIRDTQAQLKDVEKLLKLDPKNTELLAQKQRLLKDAVAQTKEKLDVLKQAREQANEALARGDENAQRQLDALQREIIDTENDLKGLTKEAQQFDEQGGRHFSSAGEKLKNALKTAAKVGAAALAAVAAAAVAMGKKLIQSANDVAEYGDAVDKNSQKIGFSTDAYQEWSDVLEHSGTSIDAVAAGTKKLFKNAQSGSKAFQKLGISQKEAASMSREELFGRTVTALQNVADENQRAALATELFGKAGQELGPLLNMSAEETRQMRDRVHDLNGIMSREAVKAAAKYQDSLQDMDTALQGLKRRYVSEFLPALTEIMDGLTLLFSGKDGSEKITSGLNSFIETLNRMIPKIVQAGGALITKLGDSITKNLPTLIPAATQAVLEIVKGLVKQLPMVVDAATQIILSLADGIAEALPELIPAIVDAILLIVDKLTEPETVQMLIEAGIRIVVALVAGISKALPKVLTSGNMITSGVVDGILAALPALALAIMEIDKTIVNGFADVIDRAFGWGGDLIRNFATGIITNPALTNALKWVGEKVKGLIGFSEPEEGPLSNFHTFAPDMMKLFAQGIRDNADLVKDAARSAFDFMPDIAANAAGREFSVSRDAAVAGAGGNMTVIFELDRAQIARSVFRLNGEETKRVGVRLDDNQ